VLLQQWWRAVGVDVTVKNYPAATLFAPAGQGGMMYGGKTDVALFSWDPSTPDPDDTTFISPHSLPPVGQNVTFYQSAEIQHWLDVGLSSYDPAVRRPAYFNLQRVLYDQVPEYVLNWTPEIIAFNVDLHGPTPNPVGSDLWDIANWTFGAGGH